MPLCQCQCQLAVLNIYDRCSWLFIWQKGGQDVHGDDFSDIVINRLNQLKMKRPELAVKAKISFPHINNLLDGRRRWNEDTKRKVCNVLGIKIEYKCVS